MSADLTKIRKVTGIFLASHKHPYKCQKNDKYNKIYDFGKEEAKRDPELYANIAKLTRNFVAS